MPPDERFWPPRLERWRQPAGVWSVAIICVIALGLRVYIAAITHGTNDIDAWKTFATLGLQHGVARVYQLHPLFNHPPLMGWYGAGVLAISNALNTEFSFLFKLVPILADTISVVLVHSIGNLSPIWLLLFAINPANVLVSAFHRQHRLLVRHAGSDLRTMLVGFLTWLTLVSYISLTLSRGSERIARSRLGQAAV